uniref:Uncharacterized protein n=1 Tax=Setaria viridis TaxID=4556 RepID=A0A4U6VSD6_SETVI|nr:hypothetical protein SEVIR_3G268100v2 [Setaria viridis]
MHNSACQYQKKAKIMEESKDHRYLAINSAFHSTPPTMIQNML